MEAIAAVTGVFDRLLGHNQWATRLLLERCRGLTPAQFTQRFDIGPGSLHDTLLHVVGAMRRWADRIEQRPLRDSIEKPKHPRPPAEILALLDDAARDFKGVADRVVEEDRLDEKFQVVFSGVPEPQVMTRGTALVHVLTHGVHHRAQCLNMLRRLGVQDLPDIDALDWEAAGR
jgi:uncharacterized damage-inducible protein DinB